MLSIIVIVFLIFLSFLPYLSYLTSKFAFIYSKDIPNEVECLAMEEVHRR